MTADRVYDEHLNLDGGPYMTQRIRLAASNTPLFDDRMSPDEGVLEAVGIHFDEGGLDPDLVRRDLLAVVLPADLMVDDVRREYDWGASGPLYHELLITLAAGTGSTLIATAILACLKRMRECLGKVRAAREDEGEPSAEQIWVRFKEFVKSSFRASSVTAVDVTRFPSGWHVLAEADGVLVEGRVSIDGVLLAASRKGIADDWDPDLD
jgi:hypothetical protein